MSLKVNQMKDFLQTPTPESRLVDQATSSNLESPDWGLNLRICSLINGEEVNGTEIVRAIKKKIGNGGGDVKSQNLGLELLEVCAMNCEKVFSEIASEKVLDEMIKVIENPEAERECRVRAMEMIRAWGESEDLNYLPVFRQTYENLKQKGLPSHMDDGTLPTMQYPIDSYLGQEPLNPPESYPVPDAGLDENSGATYQRSYGGLSAEEKKEFMEITRNSLEVLSCMLNSSDEPNVAKDDVTISLLEKCKESRPALQRIVETTTDDESLLFEALHLHDELHQVISKFEKMEVSEQPDPQVPKESISDALLPVATHEPVIQTETQSDASQDMTAKKGEESKVQASSSAQNQGSHDMTAKNGEESKIQASSSAQNQGSEKGEDAKLVAVVAADSPSGSGEVGSDNKIA